MRIRYKCANCKFIFEKEMDFSGNVCPQCGSNALDKVTREEQV